VRRGVTLQNFDLEIQTNRQNSRIALLNMSIKNQQASNNNEIMDRSYNENEDSNLDISTMNLKANDKNNTNYIEREQ
jgi:hypothetical protein